MLEIERSIKIVKQAWIESSYYEAAEQWTGMFWGPHSNFRRLFERLDVTRCAELACGHGRHAEQLMQQKGNEVEALYCLDVVANNIDVTARRLQGFAQVQCILTAGSDFQPLASGSLTSIYCYDSMVHFSPDIVEAYLNDAARVLSLGGRALFHHSNLDAPKTGQEPSLNYGQNPHARNHMTLPLFVSLASAAGLQVLETSVQDWGGTRNLDRISLLERP